MGRADTDKVVFSGNLSDYTITQNDDGSITVVDDRDGSPDGTDTITNVESFRFANGDFSPDDIIEKPVGAVTDSNGSANTIHETDGAGTQIGITASAADPDGDAVTYTLSDDRFAIDADGVVTIADHAFFDSQVESFYRSHDHGQLSRWLAVSRNIQRHSEWRLRQRIYRRYGQRQLQRIQRFQLPICRWLSAAVITSRPAAATTA